MARSLDRAHGPLARRADHGVRLLFGRANPRRATRDLDLAGYLQRLAVETQHVDSLIEHGLRQQRPAVSAPDHTLTPGCRFRLGGECELASLDAVNHHDAMIVVGLVGLWLVRTVLNGHR